MYENELKQQTTGHATGFRTNPNQNLERTTESKVSLSVDDAALLGRLLYRALDSATNPGNSANSPQNEDILSSAEAPAARSLLSDLATFTSGCAGARLLAGPDPRQPNLLDAENTPLFDELPGIG